MKRNPCKPVPVSVSCGDDPDVAGLEAERFNVRFDQSIGTRRPGIDQDQSRARIDEIASEIVRADIVHVADDLESRKRRLPFLVRDRWFTRCWANVSAARADIASNTTSTNLGFISVLLGFHKIWPQKGTNITKLFVSFVHFCG